MNIESRKKCQCDGCRYNDNTGVSINIPTENSFEALSGDETNEREDNREDYVSVRKKKKRTDLSSSGLSDTNTQAPTFTIQNSTENGTDDAVTQTLSLQSLKDEICQLRSELQTANTEIFKLKATISKLENKKYKKQEKIGNLSTPKTTGKKVERTDTVPMFEENALAVEKSNVCIISNIARNGIAQTIRNNLVKCNMIHYRIPGGGINELLCGIH